MSEIHHKTWSKPRMTTFQNIGKLSKTGEFSMVFFHVLSDNSPDILQGLILNDPSLAPKWCIQRFGQLCWVKHLKFFCFPGSPWINRIYKYQALSIIKHHHMSNYIGRAWSPTPSMIWVAAFKSLWSIAWGRMR